LHTCRARQGWGPGSGGARPRQRKLPQAEDGQLLVVLHLPRRAQQAGRAAEVVAARGAVALGAPGRGVVRRQRAVDLHLHPSGGARSAGTPGRLRCKQPGRGLQGGPPLLRARSGGQAHSRDLVD